MNISGNNDTSCVRDSSSNQETSSKPQMSMAISSIINSSCVNDSSSNQEGYSPNLLASSSTASIPQIPEGLSSVINPSHVGYRSSNQKAHSSRSFAPEFSSTTSSRPLMSGNMFSTENQSRDIRNARELSARIILEISDEFKACGFSTRSLKQSFIKPFLPQGYVDKRQTDSNLDIFRRFRSNPLTTSDSELQQIFRTHNSNLLQGPVIYFQTWPIAKKTLQIIIERMEQTQGYPKSETLNAWRYYLSGLNEDEKVFIRYIGHTIEDVHNRLCISDGKLYDDFRKHYMEFHPKAYTKDQFFALLDSKEGHYLQNPDTKAKDMHFITEELHRFLIALFRYPSLLNSRYGDCHTTFSPSSQDKKLFKDLKTTVMNKLVIQGPESGSETKFIDMEDRTKELLSEAANSIQDLMTKADITSDQEKPDILHIKTNYLREATNKLFHKHCVAAMVGEAMSLSTLESNQGLIDTGSPISKATVSFFRRLAELESTVPKYGGIHGLLDIFSFTRVYNWVGDEGRKGRRWLRQSPAKSLLHDYLNAVTPLLTITLGGRALSCCLRRDVRNVVSRMGKASIQQVGRFTQPSYTILLPQLHPEHCKQVGNPQELRRLEFLGWCHIWVYLHTTLEVLPKTNSESSEYLCKEIYNLAEERLKEANFEKTFEDAMLAYRINDRRYNKRKRSDFDGNPRKRVDKANLDSLDEASYRSQLKYLSEMSAYLTRSETFGQVCHKPGSQQRWNWTKHIWLKHRHAIEADLRLSQNDWESLVFNLPQDAHIANWFDAGRQVEDLPVGIQDLFKRMKSQKKINADPSTLTFEVKLEVFSDISQDLQEQKAKFLANRTRKMGIFDVKELKGLNVGTKNGQTTLMCRGLDGHVSRVAIKQKENLLLLRSQFSRRSLKFHPGGIMIVDEHENGILVPLTELQKSGENLYWLWQQGRAIPEAEQQQSPFYVHQTI